MGYPAEVLTFGQGRDPSLTRAGYPNRGPSGGRFMPKITPALTSAAGAIIAALITVLAALITVFAALIDASGQAPNSGGRAPNAAPIHGLIKTLGEYSYVWVFAGPTPESTRIGRAYNNTQVAVICETQRETTRGGITVAVPWYKVVYYAGKDGYIPSRYVNTGTERPAAC
jgi:Bacterial SH3 domain